MKKIWLLALIASLGWMGSESAADDLTMIVAPARYSVIQVAFDLIKQRAAVLVSYQGEVSTEEPLLHAWNGEEWVHVPLKDFRDVSFLQRVPTQTVLIGDDQTLPAVLIEASSWSPRVLRIKSLDTASLVNESHRAFGWTPAEWKWFSARYNLKLADESEALRRSSWYDQPGPLPGRPPILGHRTDATEKPAAPIVDIPPEN